MPLLSRSQQLLIPPSREPAYDYGTDSIFSIKPPVVSERDAQIYDASEQVALRGPALPSPASVEIYSQYARMTWR